MTAGGTAGREVVLETDRLLLRPWRDAVRPHRASEPGWSVPSAAFITDLEALTG
jgi:hypothetical protein